MQYCMGGLHHKAAMHQCRWTLKEALASAQPQPRASAEVRRLKQQSSDSSAFLAGSSTHARARQQQELGQSHASWTLATGLLPHVNSQRLMRRSGSSLSLLLICTHAEISWHLLYTILKI